MKKIILITAIILLLCGCEKENKICIKSHIQLQPIVVPNGIGGMRSSNIMITVCDEWEEINEN